MKYPSDGNSHPKPINSIAGSKRKSKGAPTEQDVHDSGGSRCFEQNLNLAYVFCCLNASLSKVQQESADRVIKFLKGEWTPSLTLLEPIVQQCPFPANIHQFENQNQEVSFVLVKLLRVILIANGERWMKSNVSVKELLQQVIALYQRGKFSKEIKTKILILLCDIVLNYRLSTAYG